MQVIATEAFKTYYEMLCIDVAKGDKFDGPFAQFLLTGGSPVRDVEEDPGPEEAPESSAAARTEQPSGSEPPQDPPSGEPPADLDINGTAKDVLAWVVADPGRAREAEAAEMAKDKPRSTLLTKLNEIVGA